MKNYIKYITKDTAIEGAYTLLVAILFILTAAHSAWWGIPLAVTAVTATWIILKYEKKYQQLLDKDEN